MSKFRERAAEIKARGAQERGNFTPSGIPLRIYNYWDAHTTKHVSTENFCHFWRVVLIWAPLTWLKERALDALDTKAGMVGAILLLLAAIVFGVSTSTNFAWLMGVVLVSVALVAVFVGGGLLIERYMPHSWYKYIEKAILGVLVALFVGVVGFAVTVAFIEVGWVFFAYLSGALLASAGLIYLAAWVAEYLMGRRAIEREKEHALVADMTPAEFGDYQARKTAPGIVSKFFRGVGDFIILIAQIVRVNKWKICPIVTVPKESNG